MKETGIIRPIDELGRIVLPMELRRSFDLKPKDGVEIYTDGDSIILKKYSPSCVFCGSNEGLTVFRGKPVCAGCAAEIGELSPDEK